MTLLVYAIPFLASIASGALMFAFPLSVTEHTGDSFLSGMVVLVSGATYVLTTAALMLSKPGEKRSMWIAYGGLSLLVLAGLLPAILWTPWWLTYVFTTLQGVGSAAFLVCFQIVLQRVASRYSIAVAFSNFVVAWALGYAIGPFISGLFHEVSIVVPVLFAATCSALAIGLLVAATHVATPTANVADPEPLPTGPPQVRFGWAIILLSGFFMVTYRGIFPDYGVVSGFAARQSGSMLLVLFLTLAATAFTLRFVYRSFLSRWTLFWAIPVAYVAACLALALGNAAAAYIAVALLGVAIAIGYFFAGAFALSDGDGKSRNVAVNETVVGVASIIGPLSASAIAGAASYVAFFGVSAILAIAVFALGYPRQALAHRGSYVSAPESSPET